jgi:hypothetical protein
MWFPCKADPLQTKDTGFRCTYVRKKSGERSQNFLRPEKSTRIPLKRGGWVMSFRLKDFPYASRRVLRGGWCLPLGLLWKSSHIQSL